MNFFVAIGGGIRLQITFTSTVEMVLENNWLVELFFIDL